MNKRTTSEDINDSLLPKDSYIQASGSCLCPTPIDGFGTLCVRVERVPPTNAAFFIATYHNFARNGDKGEEFIWVYMKEDKRVFERAGKVIDRKYQFGPNGLTELDCALIQLFDRAKIRRGVYHVTNKVLSTTQAATGDLVVKYGMTTGLTYGIVLPSDNPWIFYIENADKYGKPIGGSFAEPGDSGAPVLVVRGSPATYWIAGMIIQSSTTGQGIASRIGQIEAALHVQVYTKG